MSQETTLAPPTLPGIEGIRDDPTPDLFSLLRERRGWTDEYLAAIENPDHDTLMDMDRMIAELKRIHDSQELLVVVPDFDMDGITSGVLGYAGFSELGFNVTLHIPDYNRGHDVTTDDIAEVHSQYPAAKAIITCDGGVNSHEGIALARRLGMTTLVTDHHVELDPGSNADVTVDPARIGETYAHEGICGAHVLYQVLEAWAQEYMPSKMDSVHKLKLFAGIGTVSDVMPLLFENRQLVRDALSLARLLYTAPPADPEEEIDIDSTTLMTLLRAGGHNPVFVAAFEGFAIALREFTRVGKLRSVADLNEGFFGFYLAPAFNAARRIGGSMSDCFGVFVAPTPEEKAACMQRVIAGNDRRKELTVVHLEEIESTDQPLAPYVYFSDAPAGMLGLIASQLMHKTNLPTVVVHGTADMAGPTGGSARSPFWFPIIETMTEQGFTAIGHENACGVRVSDRDELLAFHGAMATAAENIMAGLLASGKLADATAPDLRFGSTPDCDAGLSDIEAIATMTERVELLTPFGHGFTRPEFELVLDLGQCHIATLGSESQHIKLTTRNGLKCLWWNSADALYLDLKERKESPFPLDRHLRLRVAFSMNNFRGNVSVQAMVERVVEDGE
ncbi:DHH family phosphoesterase [Arthrobacter sp. ES1]|uniref:DHH family phosphoesterase n=1 Tax=Arthrobacter sp. ES1 TaxID=1897056 RepID=UPI001D000C6D|nr:DHH family phosphoesterase [Arthrobacter sp. ES1]MCB5280573.1 Single-stranded-DNA-specific exonuclease RecJ [Arthrobacter sp. ES1]